MQPLTSAEKEAVTKLKSNLPDILKNAQVPENYALWTVPLDKDSTDDRLNVLLVKFLRARDMDLVKATKMLTDTLIWRKSFKADDLLDESFDDSLFSSVGYLYKTDKENRPVCYNFYGDIDQSKVFADPDKFIRWRVQLMEKCVQHIDFIHVDSMIVVHDYKGASMFGRTANAKAATKEIIKIMQDNYPEVLAVKFFVNVPWWGSTIFKLIRPLLSEATVKKFVVCSNDELYSSLTKFIPEENLPEVYRSLAPKKASTERGVNEQEKPKKKEAEVVEVLAESPEVPEPAIATVEIDEPISPNTPTAPTTTDTTNTDTTPTAPTTTVDTTHTTTAPTTATDTTHTTTAPTTATDTTHTTTAPTTATDTTTTTVDTTTITN
ncbi:CRAL/TRIO domain-containing protein [Rhizopus microsporus var. microsporus]|uniref:CRAL/TRIO domain-containing protein n=1 Tax=Rhizopus microsporus var. microsporus TaxID=86635 RepID=A0A1X0QYS6_RHIZD|nr:CRAL/TRIO domain-containing protein [Rhizopus microsporus var. microsporus]